MEKSQEMKERQVLAWLKKELGPVIRTAIAARPGIVYTEDWLAAMAYRETGMLFHRHIPSGKDLATLSSIMRGDYSQRPGETEKQYHGYGIWQIDIDSFPEFVKSGKWKDPLKCCLMAIDVLDGKRSYLVKSFPALKGDQLDRATTAAYNCGEGNVAKVIRAGQDIDSRTYNKDYSAEVWRFREIYRSI